MLCILIQLQLLVCGTGEVSVNDWRTHALINGSGREFDRVLAWFWAAVTNFSTEERARLLQFTTGCSQLPPGGFQVLFNVIIIIYRCIIIHIVLYLGIDSPFSTHCRPYVWCLTNCTHLLQSALLTRLRLL